MENFLIENRSALTTENPLGKDTCTALTISSFILNLVTFPPNSFFPCHELLLVVESKSRVALMICSVFVGEI